MRIHNSSSPQALHPELAKVLASIRECRSFDPASYLHHKATALNKYMILHNLGRCVVGTSGGIDSAVVLAIAAYAKSLEDSPIDRLIALQLPVHDPGATGQSEACIRANEVSDFVGAEKCMVDLSVTMTQLAATVESAVDIYGEDWARGQLVSYLRTPALYYTTSLLTQEGKVGIVLGTTNLDEGGYLGYFGKASDGMVDVQMISDVHKNEVYALARYLQLPASVIDVTPSGDMYDGRIDEQVFGAPYDFVELYMRWLMMPIKEQAKTLSALPTQAQEQFIVWAESLEAMHTYNGHKYLGRSPAVHLDLMNVAITGGWDNPAGGMA